MFLSCFRHSQIRFPHISVLQLFTSSTPLIAGTKMYFLKLERSILQPYCERFYMTHREEEKRRECQEVIVKVRVQECKWSPAVVAVVALLCRDPATPRTNSWLKAKPSYQTTVYNEASLRLISSACGASPLLLSGASPASSQCLREYYISLWRTSVRGKSSWDIRHGSTQIESNQNNWFCNNNCFRYSENTFNLQ